MGLGVLEDNHLEHVPGTAPLAEVLAARNLENLQDGKLHYSLFSNEVSGTAHLKHGTGKDKDIILVPQPSDSPRDPLNWSLWKKDFMLFIICIDTAVVGAWGPMITPGFGVMSQEFGIVGPSDDTTNGRVITILMRNSGGASSSSASHASSPMVWLSNSGNDPSSSVAISFSLSHLFGLPRCIRSMVYWPRVSLVVSACRHSRFLSPLQSRISTLSINVVYVSLHGVYVFPLVSALPASFLAMSSKTSVGNGLTNSVSSILYSANEAAIFFGIHIPLLYFFCPETCYKRSADLNIDLGTVNHAKELEAELEEVEAVKTAGKEIEMQEKNASQLEAHLAAQHGANERPWTKWEELRVFRGIESEDNLLKVIVRPFPMLLFPQVLYAFITYGLSTSWLIVLGSVGALIFGGPPYNMSVGEIGLLQIAGLITSILGFVSGPINDYLCKFLARRNNGIYEPEVFFFLTRLTIVPSRIHSVDFYLWHHGIFRVWYCAQ